MTAHQAMTVDKKRLLLNSIGTASAHVVNIIVLIWVLQYLLKRIPADEFALLPVISAVVVFMPIALDAFTSGIARFVTVAYTQGDLGGVTRIASTMAALNGIVAATVLTAIGLAAWKIDAFLQLAPDRVSEARWMLLLLTAGTVGLLPLAPLSVGMYVRQRFLVTSAITTAATFLRAILLVVLILGCGPKVLYVAVAAFVANVFTQLASAVCSLRLVPALRFSFVAVNFGSARGILSFGWWSTVGRTADAIRQGADPLILNHFSTAAQVTTFHVGALVDRHIRALLSLVATPLEPIFTALHADADERRLAKAFLRVTRLMLWITTPLLVPLLVFREEIMRLYLGPAFAEYESTPAVMGLLLLTFPFFAVLNPIFLLARGKGQIGHFTRWIVLGQFLNVFLTIMLVGPLRMGAIGSALATLLVAALYPVLIWPTGCRLAQVPYTQYIMDIGAGVIPGILAAGIALASRLILAFDTWPILAAAAVITPCMGWLLTIPWLRAADRRDIAAVVARVYTRRRRGLQVVSHFTRAQPERDGSGEIADRPQNDR